MKNILMLCLFWITTGQAFSQLSSVINKFPESKCVQCDYAEIDPVFNWETPADKENPSTAIKYQMITTGTPFGNPSSTPHAVSRVTAGTLGAPTPLFGNNSYRIKLSNTGTSNTRSEFYWGSGGTPFTDARWFMAAIYIPTSVCFDQRPFGLGFDFKHADAAGPAALNLKTPNGRWEINLDFPQAGGERKYDIGAIEKGKWTYWLIERNFEDDASGFIRVYQWTEGTTPIFTQRLQILGANYHEYQGENTEGYVLWGPYIWLASGNEGSGACDEGGFKGQANYEFYYDNIIIAKSTATLTDFNNFISGATSPGNQAPIVNAGPNQSITLPTSSVALDGTVSDADGTIEGNIWTQISGPNTATFSNAGLVDQTASGLIAGTYTFRLTSTDNSGASSSDDVVITVNASGGTTSGPRFTVSSCTAGTYQSGGCPSTPVPDRTITSPATTDNFDIYAVHGDTTGYTQSFALSVLSSPGGTTPSISQLAPQDTYIPTICHTSVTGMTANGTYTFIVVVTDGLTRTKSDTFSIVRSAATNTPPTVDAGSDITVTLDGFGPFTSASTILRGLSTDGDGTISSRQWSLVSGPDNSSFGTPTKDTTTFSSLVGGTYVARLLATDNSGASVTDNVQVRVLTCNAGNNQTATLATGLTTTSITLTGTSNSVSDTTDVLWTKISGTGGTITSSGTLSTTVTGLTPGTYIFQLQITHTGGYIVRDQIEVTILTASGNRYFNLKLN